MSDKKRNPRFGEDDEHEATELGAFEPPAHIPVPPTVDLTDQDRSLDLDDVQTSIERLDPGLIERMREIRRQAIGGPAKGGSAKGGPAKNSPEARQHEWLTPPPQPGLKAPHTPPPQTQTGHSWSDPKTTAKDLDSYPRQSKRATPPPARRTGPKAPTYEESGLIPKSPQQALAEETSVSTTIRVKGFSLKELQNAERYQHGNIIAKGGMGYIRAAFDKKILRLTAMKMLKPNVAQHKVELQRFLGEAQITGQLEHPNIVPVYDLGVDARGQHYFTMQYVKGRTLKEYLHQSDYDPGNESSLYKALQILLKVCDALSFAHSKGIIHRDLKPANIMVGDHGEVYLMDWGIACLLNSQHLDTQIIEPVFLSNKDIQGEMDVPGAVIGSLCYVAPEQALGQTHKIDKRADIFSLGAILYEILTLSPPYEGTTFNQLLIQAKEAHVMPPQERMPFVHLPKDLCNIAMKAMQKEPEQRFQKVHEFSEAIGASLHGEGHYPHKIFPKGTLIIQQGDTGDTAYGIIRGRCRVSKNIDGKKVILRDMGPGEVFGEAAVMSSQLRTADVEALEDATLICFHRDTLATEFGFGTWLGKLVESMAERFHENDVSRFELLRRTRQLQVANRVSATILAYGSKAPDYDDLWEAQWSLLRYQVSANTGVSEEELLSFLEPIPAFHVDLHRDVISLTMTMFTRWLDHETARGY